MEERAAGVGRAKHEWLRGYLVWDAYYLLAYGASIVCVLTIDDSTARSQVAASALLGFCTLWYALWGRILVRRDDNSWQGLCYLGILLALFTGADASASVSSIALVAIVPQMYWILRPLWANAAVVVFALAPVAVHVGRTGDLMTGLADKGPIALAIVAFSALFGTWVDRIIEQSRERAVLIQELTAARLELAEMSKRTGIAEERERLAGEIHDAIAQGLSSIVMLIQSSHSSLDQMEGLSTGHGQSVEQAQHQLELAARTARESLAEAGALVEALRPTALDADSLPEALRRLAEGAAEASGMDVRFRVTGEPEALPVAVEVVLLRVGQEALANVRKHARATSSLVELAFTDDRVALRVSDDGEGFDTSREARGYGLVSMLRRLDQVGGERELRSAPGEGTTVRVEVPR